MSPTLNGNRKPYLFAAVALFALAGCGEPEEVRPELQPAQGTLTINGKPAEGALLVLHPADDFDTRGTRPTAEVQPDGTFQLTTYQSADGAPPGDYQAAVLWFDDPDSNSPWDKLGSRYARPEQSGITVSIQAGDNQLEPITIENARIVNRPPRRPATDHDQVD